MASLDILFYNRQQRNQFKKSVGFVCVKEDIWLRLITHK